MGRVVHFEIHADHPERAIRFYSALCGWTFHKWDGPQEYWLVNTGAEGKPGVNGGLMRRRGPAPTDGQPVNAFVCSAESTSVDDDARKIAEVGGTIAVPKMPIPGIGWLLYAKDTEGNNFGLMQPDPGAK